MPFIPDMTGRRFGMLTVKHLVESKKPGAHWLCNCDCGNEKIISGKNLRKGQHACGCVSMGRRTHGMTDTRTYRVWVDMRRRCENQAREGFKNYGGRGIKVCGRWQVFENFVADMGEVPAGFSIERKDNDRGYSPDNCQWIPCTEQSKNRRSVRHLEIGGEKISLAEAARRSGVKMTTLIYRLNSGWSAERALGSAP